MSNYKYNPPRGQLLKWIGNKQKMAQEITNYFPDSFENFYEPFLGSGAILATVGPKRGYGSDIFGPLIEIWKTLTENPELLIEWYASNRSRVNKENKVEIYEEVKTRYNLNPNGRDFLFLSRACYGGVVRFRKADGFMSTPCGAHFPMPIDTFSKRVYEWYGRVKNCTFSRADYKDIFRQAGKNDFIYCDPPYVHSQGILYGAQGFSIVELFNEIENATSRGVKIALSIDGNKKSGNIICDLPIPSNLFKEEVIINCGKSMLRRFQLTGESLENEIVGDRLLLNY